MRIVQSTTILSKGITPYNQELAAIHQEISAAIQQVVWPEGSSRFTINPVQKGNGVRPIKERCMKHLKEQGWDLETRLTIASSQSAGPIDATKTLLSGGHYALEWETGNISSTHRALNKIALGITQGTLIGGSLILPSRNLYKYLTDRIGNFREIQPYFPVWASLNPQCGQITVYEIEHDSEDPSVPLIKKHTDGYGGLQKIDTP